MANSNIRKDRFTSDPGDFVLVKPAPKKSTGSKPSGGSKSAGKGSTPAKGKK